MGEAAEDILDGTVCESCGEFFEDIINGGSSPGYPRRCGRCEPRSANRAPGASPFSCPGCGRAFQHKGDRRQHRRAKAH